jgi:hypothetical protein
MYDVLRKPEVADFSLTTPPPFLIRVRATCRRRGGTSDAPPTRPSAPCSTANARRRTSLPPPPSVPHHVSSRDRSESRDLATVFELADILVRLVMPDQLPPLDLLPALRHVPARWAPWKRIVRDLRARKMAFYGELLQQCRDRIAGAPGVDAFMDEVVRRQAELGLTDDMATCVARVCLACCDPVADRRPRARTGCWARCLSRVPATRRRRQCTGSSSCSPPSRMRSAGCTTRSTASSGASACRARTTLSVCRIHRRVIPPAAVVGAHRPVAGLPQGDPQAEARGAHRRSPCRTRRRHGARRDTSAIEMLTRAQYRGHVIPKGSTVVANMCERRVSRRCASRSASSVGQGAYPTTRTCSTTQSRSSPTGSSSPSTASRPAWTTRRSGILCRSALGG